MYSTQPSKMLVVLPVDLGQAHKEQNQSRSALISGFDGLVEVGDISILN